MTFCPSCGHGSAYIGLQWIECKNKNCDYYVSENDQRRARVVWDINGKIGKTRWLPLDTAIARAEEGNDLWGEGTHTVEHE